jgi:hypothetical protein
MPLNVQALANRSRCVWRVVVLFAVGCLVTTGSIARPFLSLDQWAHTTFTTKDGAPLGVRAIAPDRDGFLWFGSEEGLTRFDGVRFVRMFADQLPPTPITALYAASDSSLWTGVRSGSASCHGSRIRTCAAPVRRRPSVSTRG